MVLKTVVFPEPANPTSPIFMPGMIPPGSAARIGPPTPTRTSGHRAVECRAGPRDPRRRQVGGESPCDRNPARGSCGGGDASPPASRHRTSGRRARSGAPGPSSCPATSLGTLPLLLLPHHQLPALDPQTRDEARQLELLPLLEELLLQPAVHHRDRHPKAADLELGRLERDVAVPGAEMPGTA